MIRNVSIKLLGICFFVLTLGTVAGWLITEDLAGERKGEAMLLAGGLVSLLIFIVQSVLFLSAGKRVFTQLLFLTSGIFSAAWFMFCLFAPLLWIDSIMFEVKLLMVTGLVLLSGSNVVESFRRFDEKWNSQQDSVRDEKLRREGKLIDWDGLIRSMDLSISIYIPGMPPGVCVAVSMLMVASMLAGFFLKNIFPLFSAFAWGVPSALVVTLFFQVAGYNAAQACRVKSLEQTFKLKFEHK